MATQKPKSSAEDIEALKDDLKQLRSDMADLVSTLGSEGGEKLAELRDRIMDKGQAAGKAIAEGAQSAKDTAEEHPFIMALVALGVGLITGAIIRGGRK